MRCSRNGSGAMERTSASSRPLSAQASGPKERAKSGSAAGRMRCFALGPRSRDGELAGDVFETVGHLRGPVLRNNSVELSQDLPQRQSRLQKQLKTEVDAVRDLQETLRTVACSCVPSWEHP